MTHLAELPSPPTPIVKPKILVVDDQAMNIQVLHSAFAGEYQVFMANSGAKALEACAKHLPDLVLLDVMMPEMDGYEVCRRLKAAPLTAGIPVIFVTAHTDEASEALGLDVGAIDFISKPINIKIVQARVKAHIQLKLQSDVLSGFAFLDGLTGARNRRYFDEQIVIEIARAKRNNQALSLILLDVDFFKLYNDHYGHLAGDDCLRRLAKTFQSCLKRPTDLVARFGGEEFVCLLADIDIAGAMHVAETLRIAVMACEIPHDQSSVHHCVTVSLGLATLDPQEPVTAAELIQMADQRLYLAKAQGRNRLVGFV
jgi:diguanylate cyclase (GGDEF)-like protein